MKALAHYVLLLVLTGIAMPLFAATATGPVDIGELPASAAGAVAVFGALLGIPSMVLTAAAYAGGRWWDWQATRAIYSTLMSMVPVTLVPLLDGEPEMIALMIAFVAGQFLYALTRKDPKVAQPESAV